MKREVDLTPNSIFSNGGFRLAGSSGKLFDPDEHKKLSKKRIPWEKTNEDVAMPVNVYHETFSYSQQFTTTVSPNRNRVAIRMIEEMIDDFIFINDDRHLETISTRESSVNNTSSLINNVTSWNIIDSWSSSPAVFRSGDDTIYMSYTEDGNEIVYRMNDKWGIAPKDKNMLKAEDGSYFIIGKAKEIKKKHKSVEERHLQYNDYSRLKSEYKRTKMGSYLFNRISFYEEPDQSFKYFKRKSHLRWDVKPHNIKPITQLEYWEKKRELNSKPIKLKESFPRRYNCIEEMFYCYDDEFDGIERRLFRLNESKRILLPEGVVKYKGHDFKDDHRKHSWQPNGRISQEWDEIFRDKNDNWDSELTPLIDMLPSSL